MTAQIPQRTCVGCRDLTDQNLLMRWVRDPEQPSRLLADPDRRQSGRGAWLHPNPECARLAVRRGGFSRAFRSGNIRPTVDVVLAELERGPVHGTSPHQSREPESGSETVETR